MSRVAQYASVLLIGLSCGWLAYSGSSGPEGFLKAASIALVAAGIALLTVRSLEVVNSATQGLSRYLGDLQKGSLGTASLVGLEQRALKRGSEGGTAEKLARGIAEEWSTRVAFARATAGSAVYIGLGGTLIGLTIAVFGLRGLHAEAESIKEQILTVVAGFGGSFASAMCGIASTVYLSWVLSKYDDTVARAEDWTERHLSETVLLGQGNMEQRLAKAVSEAVTEAFSKRIEIIWEPLRDVVAEVENAGKEFRRAATAVSGSIKQIEGLTAQMQAASAILSASGDTLNLGAAGMVESAKLLASATQRVQPSLQRLEGGVENLRLAIEGISPAIASAEQLASTVKKADTVLGKLDSVIQGTSERVYSAAEGAGRALRDDAKVVTKQTAETIAAQQDSLREQILPALGELARALNLLSLLVDKSDTLIKNLPIAAPAARIVDDLHAAGVAHLTAAERDSDAVRAAAATLEATEEKISSTIASLRDAHASLTRSLSDLNAKTSGIASNVDDINGYLERPAWKRLGGRRR